MASKKKWIDVILTMLQDKGQINKELLVNQFGEEAVDALVKDKFLREKPSAKVEEPEAFRAGLPVRPAVMSLTPKAQEFLSMKGAIKRLGALRQALLAKRLKAMPKRGRKKK